MVLGIPSPRLGYPLAGRGMSPVVGNGGGFLEEGSRGGPRSGLFYNQSSGESSLLVPALQPGSAPGHCERSKFPPFGVSVLTSVCKPRQVLSMCALSCPTAEVFPNAQDDKMQGSQVKPPPPVLSVCLGSPFRSTAVLVWAPGQAVFRVFSISKSHSSIFSPFLLTVMRCVTVGRQGSPGKV